MGRVCHLPPQTCSPSFSTPAFSPSPSGFCTGLVNGRYQPEFETQEDSEDAYIFPCCLPAETLQAVSLHSTKYTALGDRPSRLPMVATSFSSTHPGRVPYISPSLLKNSFIRPSPQDMIYTCCLSSRRALNDTGLQ